MKFLLDEDVDARLKTHLTNLGRTTQMVGMFHHTARNSQP